MTHLQTLKALRRSALALALASAFAAPAAHALDVTWQGGTGDWGNALGWAPTVVPNASDIHVFIDGGSLTNSALTLSSSVSIGSLHIDAFDALTVGNGAVLAMHGGTLTTNGTLTLAGTTHYTRLNLADNLTLAGSGQTVLGDAALNLITSNTNDKILTIAAGHTLRGGGGLGNGSYGAINVVNQGTVLVDASSGMSTYGSTFDNTAGTIEVAAGSTLHVNSTLLLADASRMTFEVDGLQAGTEFGVLALTTAANFDGQVTLDLSGFAAQVGDSFAFINYASTGSGTFDAVNAAGYALSVSYANHHVTATITAINPIPEPSSYALMLGGLGWVGLAMHRRRLRASKSAAAAQP